MRVWIASGILALDALWTDSHLPVAAEFLQEFLLKTPKVHTHERKLPDMHEVDQSKGNLAVSFHR